MADTGLDWKAIDGAPRFQRLYRRKTGCAFGLMTFALLFYLLLPVGAAYAPALYAVRVSGSLNVGIVFALLQFAVAWAIALYYAHRANAEFDPLAAAIVRDAESAPGGLR